jgi:hypothetical protein
MVWVVSVTPRPRFTPGERTPGTHWTGGWVGPRAGLDIEDGGKILCLCRESNPDSPVVQPVVRHYTAPLWRFVRIQIFMGPRWLMQVFHPPHKFERPPFSDGWRNGIRKYGVHVTFNGMTYVLNFMKINLFQNLLVGDAQTYKPHFPF